MSNIPPVNGSPVRRSDLSPSVLEDLDADDWYADCAPEDEPPTLTDEEQEAIDREDAARGARGALL